MATQQRHDVHLEIRNQIVEMLENGEGLAGCPWYRDGSITRPKNAATGKHYQGINIVALWARSAREGFTNGLWGTYRQWAELGAQVRRGESGSRIVFYKSVEKESRDGGEPELLLFARSSTVFAAEQVEGYEPQPLPESSVTPIQSVGALVRNTGAIIEHGGDSAFYRRSTDTVHMPDVERFADTESYYAVLLHELTHWTGHRSRCDRSDINSYAFEELIAELGAAFLCADLGISATPRADHAGYLESWITALKEDSRAIFRAASRASTAAEFILNHGVEQAVYTAS